MNINRHEGMALAGAGRRPLSPGGARAVRTSVAPPSPKASDGHGKAMEVTKAGTEITSSPSFVEGDADNPADGGTSSPVYPAKGGTCALAKHVRLPLKADFGSEAISAPVFSALRAATRAPRLPARSRARHCPSDLPPSDSRIPWPKAEGRAPLAPGFHKIDRVTAGGDDLRIRGTLTALSSQ
jgi:hypothetical protein